MEARAPPVPFMNSFFASKIAGIDLLCLNFDYHIIFIRLYQFHGSSKLHLNTEQLLKS